jgi:hypothetical protein
VIYNLWASSRRIHRVVAMPECSLLRLRLCETPSDGVTRASPPVLLAVEPLASLSSCGSLNSLNASDCAADKPPEVSEETSACVPGPRCARWKTGVPDSRAAEVPLSCRSPTLPDCAWPDAVPRVLPKLKSEEEDGIVEAGSGAGSADGVGVSAEPLAVEASDAAAVVS